MRTTSRRKWDSTREQQGNCSFPRLLSSGRTLIPSSQSETRRSKDARTSRRSSFQKPFRESIAPPSMERESCSTKPTGRTDVYGLTPFSSPPTRPSNRGSSCRREHDSLPPERSRATKPSYGLNCPHASTGLTMRLSETARTSRKW